MARRPRRRPGRVFARADRGARNYVYLDGQRRCLGTTDLATAHERLARLLARRGGASPLDDATVADLCRRFLAGLECSADHRGRYEQLARVLTARLARRKVRDVRPDQLRALLHDKAVTRGGPATRNRPRACLRRLFEWARELGARWPNPVTWKRERETGRPRRPLTADELRAVLAAARAGWRGCPEYLFGLVLLAVATGLRRGELLALRGRDLDQAARTLALHSTKSGACRVLALPAEVVDALPVVGPEEPLFARDPDKAWPTLLRRAGITDPSVCFHSLRHTYTTIEARAGTPSAVLREVLGQSTLATTERYLKRVGAAIPVGGAVLEVLT